MDGKDEPALLASDNDIIKHQIENQLLDYQKRFRSSIHNQKTFPERKKWEITERDYFCLLQREGLSYQALVEKILSLRQKLMESENKYIWMLQGKYSMDEKQLQEIAHWRRQLEHVENVYFILRSKHLSKYDDYQISSKHTDEDLLKMILSRKMELMKLEDEYLGLLEATKTYSLDEKGLQYAEEVLRRAVISRREFLMLEGEYNKLVKESGIRNEKELFIFLEDTLLEILNWRLEASWERRLYPSLGYDFNIDSKINLLEMIVPLRKEVIMLEDEYLYILRERYTKNWSSTSLSDIQIIHSQYVLEHLIITLLRWRNDLRMLEDRIFPRLNNRYMENTNSNPSLMSWANMQRHMESSNLSLTWTNTNDNNTSHTNIYQSARKHFRSLPEDSSTIKNIHHQPKVVSSKSLEEKEERYCKLVQESYLIIHNSISSIDVIGQIHYSKKLNTDLHYQILPILWGMSVSLLDRGDQWPMFDFEYHICSMKHIETWRQNLQKVEGRFFSHLDVIFTTNANRIQKALERFFGDNGNISRKEGEYLTSLYNSIKSYNLYCSNCNIFINKVIQSALEFEDNEREVHSQISFDDDDDDDDDEDEDEREVHKFLNSRNLICPNCNIYIRRVKIQHALAQTSTSTPTEESQNLLYNFITFGSETSKLVSHEEGEFSSTIEMGISSNDESVMIVQQRNNRGRNWGIQNCIVLGGLLESITSLSIVTSAATVDIFDENILVLALTNLITGLFIIRHNLPRVKKNKGNKVGGESQFKEVLKDKMQNLVQFSIAFLSFIFFGLVPPFVYAFSFIKNGNKDLKLVATAGASLSCTAFLAIQKAHIRKPKSWLVYFKTAAIYVSIGIGTFGLSYLGGYMFGQLTNKLPWLL